MQAAPLDLPHAHVAAGINGPDADLYFFSFPTSQCLVDHVGVLVDSGREQGAAVEWRRHCYVNAETCGSVVGEWEHCPHG